MPQIEHSHPENSKKQYEQKDMSGSLFIARNKSSDRSPDMTGEVKINGQTLRIAAWNKTAKSGLTYLSLTFSEPRERTGQSGPVGQLKQPEASVSSLLNELAEIKGGKKNDDVPF